MFHSRATAILLSFAAAYGGPEQIALADEGPTGDALLRAAGDADGPVDQVEDPGPTAGEDPSPGSTASALDGGTATTAATAFFDPASYLHYDVIYPFPAGTSYGYASGPVACPTGTKAVSWGATSSDLKSMLMNGTTFLDASGAFASAWGRGGYEVQVSARCVNAAQVQNAKLASRTLRDHRGGWRSYVQKATCPDGTIAYAGGGSTYQYGLPTVHGLYQLGSMPSTDAREWIYAGAGDLGYSGNLVVSAQTTRFPE
jgi:hypothetical protein